MARGPVVTGERAVAQVPPLGDFFARRFAVRSPLVSWLVFERAGGSVAFLFAHAGISPSAATLLGGLLGAAGAVLLAVAAGPAGAVVAGVVLLASYVLDCTDGQLARATHRTSAFGAWLDVAADAVVVAVVSVALSVALVDGGLDPAWAVVLAGAFGASRTVSLFTATQVRRADGGLQLAGAAATARALYVAAMDTPVVYLALALTRLVTPAFVAVIAVLVLMTVVQTAVSVRHHFREEP